MNWDTIINVPVTVGGVNLSCDLLSQHGMLTIAQVHAHVLPYQGFYGRAAHNSQQMYTFLYKSLDFQARMRMSMQEEQYKITVGNNSYYSGPLYLKVLVGIAHIDTRSTTSHLRETMSSLDKYIVTVDYNIETFNQYVASQSSALLARGDTSNDLLVNFFKAYLLVPGVTFTNYIQKQKGDYDDGDDKVTENSLMAKGPIKHKILVKEGKYNVPTKEEQKIIALSADNDDLKNKNSELTAQLN